MADSYLAELRRTATASSAGMKLFDSGSECIEIVLDLDEALPSGERVLVGSLWTTAKAIERTKKTLQSVGVNLNDAALENDDQLCAAIAGKKFNLTCALEAPNDFHRNEKWIVRYINGPKAELVGSLLSRLRGSQQSLPLGGSDDSDVPF